MDRGWKPNVDQISPNCPRCGSSNTKFCYYNNYSLTQPRYFCKGCRRYWTKGGSLRNVPVGGGCRKNRRGKSPRLASDGVPKSLAYGGVANDVTGRSNGHRGSSPVKSSSSSIMPDSSHIDLALVYANFLNQQPDCKIPELPSELEHPLPVEFPSISNTNLDSSIHSPEENGLPGHLSMSDLSVETRLRDNEQMYFRGFDPIQKHQDKFEQFTNDTSNNGLPPLPGEESATQEMLWSNSNMMADHHTLRATQQRVVVPDVQDPNLLFGDWSPLDFSSDDTFSKT